MKIDNEAEKVKAWAKLLGAKIDAELNFSLHIANICRSSANTRIRKFLGFEEKKKRLVNSYFYSNFNYCPLVWIGCYIPKLHP